MSSPPDNRRLTGRILAYEFIDLLSEMARLHGGDVVALLIFTGVWTANTRHLRSTTDRYAALHDIPPDSQRRPISEEDLSVHLCMPRQIQDPYVEGLLASGLLERRPGGLVVPSAIFTRPEMLSGANETYGRLISMLARLRQAGISLGEADDQVKGDASVTLARSSGTWLGAGSTKGEDVMSADGNWKITINTPMGAQTVDAVITTNGDTFTGTTSGQMGTQSVEGKVNGDTLTWSTQITSPMPMTLEFEAKVAGDTMSGNVKLGAFGSAPMNGVRA